MLSHMTHMSHVEHISFNATMLKVLAENPPPTAFIDQCAALLVKDRNLLVIPGQNNIIFGLCLFHHIYN